MASKENITTNKEEIINHLRNQIAAHQKAIGDLKLTIKMWEDQKPIEAMPVKINSPLTRDLIRRLLNAYKEPIQTTQAIDILYKRISDEERTKLIRRLSIMLNQMAENDEVIIEKKKGVKGNFYKLKK